VAGEEVVLDKHLVGVPQVVVIDEVADVGSELGPLLHVVVALAGHLVTVDDVLEL
jgi:hypothetical protein